MNGIAMNSIGAVLFTWIVIFFNRSEFRLDLKQEEEKIKEKEDEE